VRLRLRLQHRPRHGHYQPPPGDRYGPVVAYLTAPTPISGGDDRIDACLVSELFKQAKNWNYQPVGTLSYIESAAKRLQGSPGLFDGRKTG
jgi:hypothetical protein